MYFFVVGFFVVGFFVFVFVFSCIFIVFFYCIIMTIYKYPQKKKKKKCMIVYAHVTNGINSLRTSVAAFVTITYPM